MRLAILSPAAELGGAERSLLTFLKAAQGTLVEAMVLLPREGPLAGALTRLNVPWEVAPMPREVMSLSREQGAQSAAGLLKAILPGLRYAAGLRCKINHLAPEVIYTNGIKSHVMAALLAPWVKGRVVWHLRDFWPGRYAGFLADRGTDAIIANSRAVAQDLQKRLRHPGKITVVHNAVDPEEFSPDGPTPPPGAWSKFGLRVGLVAAFARLKGHARFFDAARHIAEEFPQAGFLVVGGEIYDSGRAAGYGDCLRRQARESGLEDRVQFTGFQTDMAPWYRAMDVVVSASVQPESFGRTLLEAMSCGRAVVGPRAGGIPEFVRHGDNGLLYDMGDSEELAAAVIALLRSPALRARLGKAGREAALKHFSPKKHAALIARVLHGVVL